MSIPVHKANDVIIRSIIPNFHWKPSGDTSHVYESDHLNFYRSEWGYITITHIATKNQIRFDSFHQIITVKEILNLSNGKNNDMA